jgi:hypothetical protein
MEKKRCCKICSFYLAPQVEGDYCVECLHFNLHLVGDFRIDPANESLIRDNWDRLKKHYPVGESK